MWYVREKLKELDEDLFEVLERNWDIAFNEWLPALDAKNDSYNSYPHLRNLESQLDRIVMAFEFRTGGKKKFFVSAIEIYTILASILFHDIGKITATAGHGKESARILNENYAELGIPLESLASIIADICKFHDMPPEEASSELPKIATVLIEPYGEIRGKPLAAILSLIDHLDGSISRTIPNYLKPIGSKKIVGAFRSVIQSIGVDLDGQLIKVELCERKMEDGGSFWKSVSDAERIVLELDPKPFSSRYSVEAEKLLAKNWETYADWSAIVKDDLGGVAIAHRPSVDTKGGVSLLETLTGKADPPSSLISEMIAEKYLRMREREKRIDFDNYFDILSNLKGNPEKAAAVDNFYARHPETKAKIDAEMDRKSRGPLTSPTFTRLEVLLLKELFEQINKIHEPSFSWPCELILSTILGDIRENNRAVRPIRSTLFALNVPVKKWLIEYKEHLFTDRGEETYEPIFYKDYLKRTADCMWKLSVGVFGNSLFSYCTLAAQMRESDEKKVRLAVRRINILTVRDSINRAFTPWADPKKESQITSAIWVGEDGWKWNIKENKGSGGDVSECIFIHVGEVKMRIDLLAEPEGSHD
jgi:hypothetical protein